MSENKYIPKYGVILSSINGTLYYDDFAHCPYAWQFYTLIWELDTKKILREPPPGELLHIIIKLINSPRKPEDRVFNRSGAALPRPAVLSDLPYLRAENT